MHSPVLAKRVHELKETQKGATAYVPLNGLMKVYV